MPNRHLPRHDWSVIVVVLHTLYRWELLWIDGPFRSDCDMRRRAVLGCVGNSLHELRHGPVSREHCINKLRELSNRYFPQQCWSVVVGDLRSVHGWELLRHDRALSCHRYMFGWILFDSFSLELFVMFLWLLPSIYRIIQLLDMCRGQLLGCCFKRVFELRCGYV
jgi:hypothetical protein